MKILKEKLVRQVLLDDELMLQLAKTNDVRVCTIDRWLRSNDVKLTTASNLELIAEHFKITDLLEML